MAFASLFLVLVASALTLGDQTFVELYLSARDLPNADVCCSEPVYPSDAYAKLYYATSDFDVYQHQFDTGVISNEPNPDWTEIFQVSVDNVASGTARIRVEIYDADSPDADDNLGFAEVHLRDLVGSFGHVVERELTGGETGGKLRVSGRVNGTRTPYANNPVVRIPVPLPIVTITELGQD